MTIRRLTRREYAVDFVGTVATWPIYRRREWRGRAATEAWQLRRVGELADHAYRNVPLYHDLYAAAGYREGSIGSWADFRALPTVGKADLVGAFPERSTARDTELERCLLSTSSGSTGRMMVIPHRADRLWPYIHSTHRLLRWAAGDRYPFWWRQAYIYTSEWPLLRVPGFFPLVFIPTTNDVEPMLAALRDCRPQILAVYPTVLRDLIAADPRAMRRLRLRGVSVSSEASTQEERDSWSRALGCPVRDEYSSEELGRIASQCPAGAYHLQEDIVVTEILDPGTQLPTDGIGEVVGTELHNRTLPFIRYRQGDLARLDASSTCDCGRPSRLLVDLAGRANDGFELDGGRRLSPGFLLDACYRAVLGHPGVVDAYRLVQRARDRADLEVVRGPAWTDSCDAGLGAALGTELHGALSIRVVAVERLDRGAAGKRATIVRDFDAPGSASRSEPDHAGQPVSGLGIARNE